jgi:DNA-directed RNA polymerase specialized sigma24 family protein
VAARLEPGASADATKVENLLASVESDDRQNIALHRLDEMSHAEIAARLGISPAVSRIRLARAIIALRELAARKEGGR